MNKLSSAVTKLQEQMETRASAPVPAPSVEEDAMAQAFMNEVFGGAAPPMFLHPFAGNPSATSAVVIEEAPEKDDNTAPAETTGTPAPVEDDVDTHSVITTSQISKSKVRKMSAEALRELCKERGLDTEGTRAVLMERILATLDD